MNLVPAPSNRTIWFALFGVLALRLIHLGAAVNGPLTWQLGPDELYYYEFGRDVAFGSGGFREIDGFMDPLYGYLVGAVLLLGKGLFPLYLLQAVADTATAYAIYRIGAALDRPGVGFAAMLVYGFVGTAIAYTSAVLKTTWVAASVAWWIVLVLALIRSPTYWRWAAFGLFSGLTVALRANLLLLIPLGFVVITLNQGFVRGRTSSRVRALTAFSIGIFLPLAVLVARNHMIAGGWTIAPTNAGIVLHQNYNPDNPESRSGVPRFVPHYSSPPDIWRAYRREAEARTGQKLSPHAISRYWSRQAIRYLLEHPGQSTLNAVRKLRIFSAYPEVPNTRNYEDERRVSPLLAALPLPFGWLFALGLPGMLGWAWTDRRALTVLGPVAMGISTIAIFFAEDRFRFNIIVPFVLGSAWWIAQIIDRIRARDVPRLIGAASLSLLLGAWSVWQSIALLPPFASDWERIAWGYLRSGDRASAEVVIGDALKRDPSANGAMELMGYLALQDGRPEDAARFFQGALAQRPEKSVTWHNLSLALEQSNQIERALAASAEADRLTPSSVSAIRLGDVLAKLGRKDEALEQWGAALRRDASPDIRAQVNQRLGDP
jgi:tetratricopeptide (TPR) repeat protein